nr:hypothetical protein [Tanacetum cinerariifolium]
MSDTLPPMPPALGANTAQNVVDENLPQLLDNRGGTHVINVPEFNKEDFTSWKDRFLIYLDVLAYEGPSETKDNKIAALRLKFNAFKALEGEKVNGTFTRIKSLLNKLENNGVSIPQALYGKYNYKEGLLDQIYESEPTRFTIQASTSKALIFNPSMQDSDSDIEEDQRNSSEGLANLNAEFHERALLSNQKRFYKWSRMVGSPKKPMDMSNETCFACGKLGHFQKDCLLIKNSTPPYPSASKSYNKRKFHTNSTPHHNQNVNNNQNGYRVKYKGLKVKIFVLTKKINAMNKGMSEKGLVAESFDWDEVSVSFDDEGVITFKALMVVADKELPVRRADARLGQWVEITMQKAQKLLFLNDGDERKHVLDYTHMNLQYVKDQRKTLLNKFHTLKQEFSSCNSLRPLPSLPKLNGAEPSGNKKCLAITKTKHTTNKVVPVNVKQKTETKSPHDSPTKKLLFTLMQEVKSLKKQIQTYLETSLPTSQSGSSRSSKGSLTSKDKKWKKHIMLHSVKMMKQFLNQAQKIEDIQVFNEPDNLESVGMLKPDKVQISIINEPICKVIPSSLIHSQSTNPPAPQDRWSRGKHIELVNIIGEPLDGPDESGVSINETVFRGMIGYQANPKESHLVAVKRIFWYLKETPNLGLWYPKGSGFDLKAYSDSEYAGFNLDRKSTSRGYHILGGKDCILKGDIKLYFVLTDLQLAGIFTKPLAKPSFTRLVAELSMLNIKSDVSDKKKALNDPLISILNIFMDFAPLPSHEAMKDAIATLGLTDKKNHATTYVDLAHSSPLRIKYFSLTWRVLMGLDIDIAGIIYSKLTTKLSFRGKKGREKNVCYVRYLSLVMEHLLGKDHVPLTTHMRKVSKLSEQPLIHSPEEVNVEDTDDKSLSRTYVHHVYQSTAKTNKKLKKKKIPSSSEPKVSKTSIEASKLAEDQENQPQTANTTKVQEKIVKEGETNIEDDVELVDSDLHSIGDVTLKSLNEPADESPYDTVSEIKVIKSIFQDNYDLESMPGDEIGLVSKSKTSAYEEDDIHSLHKKLSNSEERDADNIIKEMADMNAFAENPSLSNPFSHLHNDLNNLTTKVQNLESFISKQVSDKLKETVPFLVAETLREIFPELILEILKTALPHVISESAQQIIKPINKQFNAFNKFKVTPFVTL